MNSDLFYSRLKTSFVSFFFLLIIFSLLSVGACGRKSGLRPPEESAPGPVGFPRLEASSESLVLKWRAPSKTAGGDDITGYLRYEILRREIGKSGVSSFEDIAIIEPDKEELKKDPDKTFVYEDSDIVPGRQYEYLIVPRDSYGYEGVPDVRLRATFIGIASVVEILPFMEDESEEEN